jgi:glycosyltransferase involved in cell wall biosynthesis
VGYVPFGKALDLVQELAYRTLGRSVLAAATALVACAPHVPEYFRSLGVKKPFSLVRNGIDDTRFVVRTEADRAALRARAGIDPAAKVMLFSGRLVAKKGVAKVAEVQRALAAEGITLVVAGDGPLAHLFEGLPSTVRLGAVSPERMPEIYAMADAYVLPSRGEGLPLGVQESLLSGTPVVVSDDPAFRDGLDGLAGVRFVSERDGLADVVREALAARPSRDEVRGSAKGAWGLDAFLTAYEGILGEAARSRFA